MRFIPAICMFIALCLLTGMTVRNIYEHRTDNTEHIKPCCSCEQTVYPIASEEMTLEIDTFLKENK